MLFVCMWGNEVRVRASRAVLTMIEWCGMVFTIGCVRSIGDNERERGGGGWREGAIHNSLKQLYSSVFPLSPTLVTSSPQQLTSVFPILFVLAFLTVFRSTNVECDPKICSHGEEDCGNRRLQLRQYVKTEVFHTGNPERGWGVRCMDDVAEGDLIVEYCGEVISKQEALDRLKSAHDRGQTNFYIFEAGPDLVSGVP